MAENNQEVSDSDRIADVRANYYALIRSLREAVEHASKIISEAFHRLAQLGFSGGLFRRLKYAGDAIVRHTENAECGGG